MYKVNPCVDDFTLDQNRSCSICNKVVADLTDKTEEEVVQLYNINKGNLCGSAPSRYFNTSYYLHPFKRFAFSILLVFGSSLFVLDAAAQDSIQAIQQELPKVSEDNKEYDLTINGIVTDESGELIPFARVYFIKGKDRIGSATNFAGEYQIKVSDFK